MLWENFLYLIALAVPPILLVLSWRGWLRVLQIQLPKWRAILFLSGLCAATTNFLLLWTWAIWLRFRYNPASWRVQNIASDVGLCLLLYSTIAAVAGEGRYRLILGLSGVLALLPWIPMGTL